MNLKVKGGKVECPKEGAELNWRSCLNCSMVSELFWLTRVGLRQPESVECLYQRKETEDGAIGTDDGKVGVNNQAG